MRIQLKQLVEFFIEILFPRGEKVLALEKLIQNNNLKSLPKAENSHSHHFSLFSYKSPLVKELVWQIKYHKHDLFTQAVGLLLYEEILEAVADNFFFRDTSKKLLLIPVPMTQKRKRTRGWNQTEEIAKAILTNDTSALFEYFNNVLMKKDHALPQTETYSKKKRLQNAVGAYYLKDPTLIEGRNIIIIDDVRTTGATLEEITRIVKKAKASQVVCFSIAH